MAKGRKFTTSRSERYLGSSGHGGHDHRMVAETAEFGEDDMWSMVDDMVNGGDNQSINGSGGEWIPRAAVETNGSVGFIKSRRHVPRGDRHVGGLSLAFDYDSGKTASPRIVHQFRGQDSVASPRGRHIATSAPVNVPDWSKIYRVDSVESLHELDDGGGDDLEMVPPHEYVAREYRRMAANSVFEGVGRTLKGRDMSRVRDAVWSQTGFNG